MAEQDNAEKSEDPTQRRLEEAHKKGDVAKSQEINTWFVLSGATLVILAFAQGMAGTLAGYFGGMLGNLGAISLSAPDTRGLFVQVILATLAAIGIPFAVLAAAALAGNLIQHRLVWSLDPVTPKLSKISPLAGFKRLFSAQSLVNFVKGLLKLVIVAAVMFLIVWPDRDRLDTLMTLDPADLLTVVQALALKLLAGVIAVMTVVAGLDFAWQHHSWYQRQRMSLREIKDEYKQAEGDPMIRAKLRQVRAERSRKRMMAQVPQATVVITNPTHYAVALRYTTGQNAPVCVAKGVDRIALRIREIAEEHGVPVVENPPLARTLHAAVDVDAEIAPEHYKAVAQIIGYVMQMKARAAWRTNRP